MLDSETEPCLMMEHVLEDVIIPDGHSHNMISSGHSLARLTRSESLHNLNRQMTDQDSMNGSFMSDVSSLTDLCTPVTLVDQVIEVDNVITRLLKVRSCMSEVINVKRRQLHHKSTTTTFSLSTSIFYLTYKSTFSSWFIFCL